MHLGYAKNVVRRIDEEWTEQSSAPAKLLAEITPLKAAVDASITAEAAAHA